MTDRRVRPTREELEAARDRTIPDVLTDGLDLVFVGINPSLYSAAVGHHFARPGNRFCPALHAGGITDRQLDPAEDARLPEYGCGLTNVVERATARADELSREEIVSGAKRLARRIERHRPRCVVFLGITTYRTAFDARHATIGARDHTIGGAAVHVLPNPSGLNAHYQLPDFARLFTALRADHGDR